MITIEISVIGPNQQPQIWHAVDSDDATAMIRAALSAAAKDWTRIWLRVTGDTTAASCRHHPLAPGLIGDPRR